MYVQRPVEFDSINYLPGFPSLSVYSCDPFSWDTLTGGCAGGPVAIGREKAGVNDATAMALAIVGAAAKSPVRLWSSGSRGGDRHARPMHLSGQHGADHHHYVDARGSGGRRFAHLNGCGCGGSCGSCGGPMGLGFDMTTITTWLMANWMPLLIGGGVVRFLKRR